MTMKFNERVPFSAVFSLRRGLNITRANYQENGVPCLSYGDVHSRYLGFVDAAVHPLPKVSTDYLDSAPQCLLKAGEFVFADTSEDYEGAGNCTCVLNESDGLFAGYHTTVASPVRKEICSRYYGYYFLSEDFRNQICKAISGIKVFSITNGILNATRLLFPNLKTQENIANFLDKKLNYIDTLIEQKREESKKLSEYRQSLITQVVTKGLNTNVEMKDSGVPWWGIIPTHWHVEKLGFFAQTKSGTTPSSSNRSYYEDGIHNWVRTTDLNLGEITDTPVKLTELALKETACQYVPKDSVLIAMYGGAGTVGKYGLLQVESTLNQAVCAIFPNSKVLPKYLFYQAAAFRKYWMVYALSTRKDPNISQEDIQRWKVFIPPLKEQNDIIKYLDKKVSEIDTISTLTQQAIELLTEYRSSLISAAVTGELNIEEVTHGE